MKRVLLLLGLLGAPACSYGPEEDHSRFVSAAWIPPNTILFSYASTKYRPPQGLATFPDGGSVRYTVDEDAVGMYDVAAKTIRFIKREANSRFAADQGHFAFARQCGSMLVLGHGGQGRDLNPASESFLFDPVAGTEEPFMGPASLRHPGYVDAYEYLVTPKGHVVLVAPTLVTASQGWRQLWVRFPGDTYVRIDSIAEIQNYYYVVNGNVVYWVASPREFRSYSLETRATRTLPGYVPDEFRRLSDCPPVDSVRVASDGASIERGTAAGFVPSGLTKDLLIQALNR